MEVAKISSIEACCSSRVFCLGFSRFKGTNLSVSLDVFSTFELLKCQQRVACYIYYLDVNVRNLRALKSSITVSATLQFQQLCGSLSKHFSETFLASE